MAADIFLKIGDIKGESSDSKHKDEIELLSWSWGVSNPGSMATGSGGGRGKASFQDLHMTHNIDSASHRLFAACATGEHIKEATLTQRKQGGKQEIFLKIKLTDIIVSSYQTGGNDGGGLPTEQFSLNYAKVEFSYAPQKADGSVGAFMNSGYDLKKTDKV